MRTDLKLDHSDALPLAPARASAAPSRPAVVRPIQDRCDVSEFNKREVGRDAYPASDYRKADIEARRDTERELLMNPRRIETLIERAKRERAEFMAALLWRSVARLKSLFRPVRLQDSQVIAGASSTAAPTVLVNIESRRSAVNSIKHLILSAVVFVTMPAFADQANTKSLTFNECATRDARFMLQLEQHGEQASRSGDRPYGAFLTMLQARAACSAGRWDEGLALYDGPFGPVRNNLTPAICSERHLQVLGLIEELGEVAAVAGQKLFEAFIAMWHAHNVCTEGRSHEAVAIYDATVLGLTSAHAAR